MQPNCADNLLRAMKTFMSQVKIGLATGKHVKPVQPVSCGQNWSGRMMLIQGTLSAQVSRVWRSSRTAETVQACERNGIQT